MVYAYAYSLICTGHLLEAIEHSRTQKTQNGPEFGKLVRERPVTRNPHLEADDVRDKLRKKAKQYFVNLSITDDKSYGTMRHVRSGKNTRVGNRRNFAYFSLWHPK